MINTINYLKLKRLLLTYFRNTRVCIELQGSIDTKIFIDKSKISINKHKVVIFNEDEDFTIEFLEMKKLKFKNKFCIEMIYKDFKITLVL